MFECWTLTLGVKDAEKLGNPIFKQQLYMILLKIVYREKCVTMGRKMLELI